MKAVVDDNAARYRKYMSKFYINYALLVINAFGLQNALENSSLDMGHFFARCHSAAMTCATIVRDNLGPEYMKYSPDSHCVICSYAVLSLLKVSSCLAQIRPGIYRLYAAYETRIRNLPPRREIYNPTRH